MQATYSELEQEVSRLTRALASRSRQIGQDTIANLRDRFSVVAVAEMTLVSLESLLWVDAEAFIWAVGQLPPEIIQEIRHITSVTVGKQLIHKGFQPGQDFSVDSTGRLLLNDAAKATVLQTRS